MAEISLTASIIAIVQISQAVFTQAYKYGTEVKNARKDTAVIESEVKDVYNLLIKLRDVVERAERSGTSLERWPTLASMKLKGGPLDQSKSALDCLLSELASANRFAKLTERMLWPRKRKRVQEALQVLKKQKEFFQQALNIEQAYDVLPPKISTYMLSYLEVKS